jgi:hypothetical protein
MGLPKSPVTKDRRVAINAVCAAILPARMQSSVTRNCLGYVAAISDAVADAPWIVSSR